MVTFSWFREPILLCHVISTDLGQDGRQKRSEEPLQHDQLLLEAVAQRRRRQPPPRRRAVVVRRRIVVVGTVRRLRRAGLSGLLSRAPPMRMAGNAAPLGELARQQVVVERLERQRGAAARARACAPRRR